MSGPLGSSKPSCLVSTDCFSASWLPNMAMLATCFNEPRSLHKRRFVARMKGHLRLEDGEQVKNSVAVVLG